MADLTAMLSGSAYRPPPRAAVSRSTSARPIPAWQELLASQRSAAPSAEQQKIAALRAELERRAKVILASPTGMQRQPITPSPTPVQRPRSLWQQVKDPIKGLPQMTAGLVKMGGTTAVAFPRMLGEAAYGVATGQDSPTLRRAREAGADRFNEDLLGDKTIEYMERKGISRQKPGLMGVGGFADQYIPLASMMARSLDESRVRAGEALQGDFSQYQRAVEEGRIVDLVLEDAGNIGIVGGAAAKTLGRAPKQMSVPVQTARAIEGGGRTRSLSSAVAAADDLGRARMSPLSTLDDSQLAVSARGAVEPLHRMVTRPGEGIAGALHEAGYTKAAASTEKFGRGVYRVGRLGQAIEDTAFALPFQAVGKAAGVAGRPALRAGGKWAQDFSETRTGYMADVAGHFGTVNRKIHRDVRKLELELGRDLTKQERSYINALAEADRAGLSSSQSRAALFNVDQRFIPVAEQLRKLADAGVDDAIRQNVIDRAYANRAAEMRPELADFDTYRDWKDGALDDVTSGAMSKVEQLVTRGADRYTQQVLSADVLSPEQLGDDFLAKPLEAERRKIEVRRNRKQAELDRVTARAAHTIRQADINKSLGVEIPPPPDPKMLVSQGVEAGKLVEQSAALRRDYQIATSELNAAIDRYDRAVKDAGVDSEIVSRLGKELDRKIADADKITTDIRTLERREDVMRSPVAQISEVVEGEGLPQQPQPPIEAIDLSDKPTVTAISDAMDEIRRPAAAEAARHVEGFIGGRIVLARRRIDKGKKAGQAVGPEVPSLDGTNVPILPDDWSLAEISRTPEQALRYSTDGWMGGRVRLDPNDIGGSAAPSTRGVPLDIWVDQVNARLGKDWSPEQAMAEYMKAIDNFYDARSVSSEAAIMQVADAMAVPPEAVRIAIEQGAAAYKAFMQDAAASALVEIREVFMDMEPSIREALVDELSDLREAGASSEIIGDYIESVLESEGVGTRILEHVWDTVPMADIADYIRRGEISETIYKTVFTKPDQLQAGQLARLQQKIVDSNAQLRSVYSDQRSLRGIVDKTQRLMDRRVDRAGQDVDVWGEAVEGLAADVGALPDEVAMPSTNAGLWKRTRGTRTLPDGTKIKTDPPSPAERAVARQAVLDSNARAQQTAVNRVDRQVRKYNERIEDLPNELNREYVARLREDVNQPAVRTMERTVRTIGKPLGEAWYTEAGPVATGVIGDIAERYGILDEVVDALETQQGGMEPMHARQVLEQVIDETGASHVVDVDGVPTRRAGLSDVDRAELGRAWQAEQILFEISEVVEANNNANMPFRVNDLIREIVTNPAFDQIPADTLTRLDKQWGRYLNRRAKFLSETFDAQAAVMPNRYRAIGGNARMAVRGLLDEAEALHKAGDSQSASLLMQAAEDIPTTMAKMIEQGIDPAAYLTGGSAPSIASAFGGGRSIRQRELRASHVSKEGLRPVDLQNVVRLQMHEANQFLINNAANYIESNMAVPASQVIGDAIADWNEAHPFDDVPPPDVLDAALQESGHAPLKKGTTGPATLVIPDYLAKELSKMRQQPGLAWRGLNKANTIFKTSVLPLSPRWLSGNLVGNALMAMFNYGMSPLELARLTSEIAELEGGWKQLRRQGGLASFAPDDLASHGLTYNEHHLRWGTRDQLMAAVGEADAKPTFGKRAKTKGYDVISASYNLNEFVDNLGRSAVYLKEFRKAGNDAAATRAALNAMGDFTRMSPFERKWVRQVFPFYAWLRHQTVAAMRLPLQSPTRAAYLLHLSNMMNDPEYGEEMRTLLGSKIRFGENIPVMGGQYWNFGGLSPFADPTELPLDPSNPDLVRSVSPAVKLPYKIVRGQDISGDALSRPWQDRPTDVFGQDQPKSPLRRMLESPLEGLGEIGYLASGELPQTRAIRDTILGPGEFRYQSGDRGPAQYDRDVSVIDTLLRGAAIPNRTDNVDIDQMLRDQAKRDAEARRRAAAGR